MALCTASVVTPAPPTAGRKVKIWASVDSARLGPLATRAQVRTSSTGETGLMRKSAARGGQERARDVLVEGLRDHDYRRGGADAAHQSVQRLHLGQLGGIEVDDGNGRPRHVQLGFKPGQRAGNNPQDDLIAGAEGFARLRPRSSCPQ